MLTSVCYLALARNSISNIWSTSSWPWPLPLPGPSSRRNDSQLCMQLSSDATKSRPDGNIAAHSFDGHPPPHFYGELVRTEEGCKYLRAAGHLEDFAAIVSLHEDSDLDAEYVVMLKAVLWALVSPPVTPTKDMTSLMRILSAGAHRIFVAGLTSARRIRPLDSNCSDCGVLAGVFVTRVGGDREKDASIAAAADSDPAAQNGYICPMPLDEHRRRRGDSRRARLGKRL